MFVVYKLHDIQSQETIMSLLHSHETVHIMVIYCRYWAYKASLFQLAWRNMRLQITDQIGEFVSVPYIECTFEQSTNQSRARGYGDLSCYVTLIHPIMMPLAKLFKQTVIAL